MRWRRGSSRWPSARLDQEYLGRVVRNRAEPAPALTWPRAQVPSSRKARTRYLPARGSGGGRGGGWRGWESDPCRPGGSRAGGPRIPRGNIRRPGLFPLPPRKLPGTWRRVPWAVSSWKEENQAAFFNEGLELLFHVGPRGGAVPDHQGLGGKVELSGMHGVRHGAFLPGSPGGAAIKERILPRFSGRSVDQDVCRGLGAKVKKEMSSLKNRHGAGKRSRSRIPCPAAGGFPCGWWLLPRPAGG